VAGIDETLTKMMLQLMSDNPHLQDAAKTRIHHYLISHDIRDLSVLAGDFAQTWNETFSRLQQADREVDYWRRRSPPSEVRRAIMSGDIEYRWPELHRMVEQRFVDPAGRMQRNWQRLFADKCNVSVATVKLWEEGLARIPETVFEIMRTIPVVAQNRPERKKTHKQSSQYPWPLEVFQPLTDLYLRGASKATMVEVARKLGMEEMTENMLLGKFENGRPPHFLNVSPRSAGEPIDWPELWLIGSTVFLGTKDGKRQRGWRTRSLQAIGCSSGLYPPVDLNLGDNQDRIDAFRQRYIEHVLDSRKVIPKTLADSIARQPIKDYVESFGKDGATRDEIRRHLGPKYLRRVSELVKSLDLFDIGHSRGGQVVYCTDTFAQDHPLAWERAQQVYNKKEPLPNTLMLPAA